MMDRLPSSAVSSTYKPATVMDRLPSFAVSSTYTPATINVIPGQSSPLVCLVVATVASLLEDQHQFVHIFSSDV